MIRLRFGTRAGCRLQGNVRVVKMVQLGDEVLRLCHFERFWHSADPARRQRAGIRSPSEGEKAPVRLLSFTVGRLGELEIPSRVLRSTAGLSL